MSRCGVELLDRRICLADFAHLSSRGTLIVEGTEFANIITVSNDENFVYAKRGRLVAMFPRDDVKRISVNGRNGDDSISNFTGLRSTLLGSGRQDTLVGGRNVDSLDGGSSDDHMLPGEIGGNTVTDIIGSNLVDYTGTRPGQFGFDSIVPGSSTYRLIRSNELRDTIQAALGLRIRATNGDDHIVGDVDHRITIDGGGGDDEFDVTRANDIEGAQLVGGRGNDTFHFDEDGSVEVATGNAGNDEFYDQIGATSGTLGQIIVNGGSGDDTMYAGGGQIRYDLPTAIETLVARGTSIFAGNEEDNDISVFGRGVSVEGGSGDDTISVDDDSGEDEMSTISGGDGNDQITGSGTRFDFRGDGGDDTITGWNRDDMISGGPGRDSLLGDDGDDFFLADDNMIDHINGGRGDDTAIIDENVDVITSVETTL